MKWTGTIVLLLLIMMNYHCADAQDSVQKNKKLTTSGYIKNMQTLSFNKDFTELVSGNLLHNRINLKWKPSSVITMAAEFRTRLFWGEEVKITPGFKDLLRNENEALDMSVLWIANRNILLHTNTERLWFEYRKEKWNMRLGRQRVNWGIATTWNPNDIFNTYSFLDFDFEERPGSDAIKTQYLFNDFSNIEIAACIAGNRNELIASGKYFLNKGGYDFQFLAGVYRQRATAGVGWAGNIKNTGFKGEGQVYFGGKDSGTSFNYTIEADHVLKKGWYINGALLYSSEGLAAPVNDWTKISFSATPVKLMPARWNIILTGAKEITPLFSARLSTVYSPKVNLLIFLPSLSYSLTEDLNADLVWQSFFSELNHHFAAVNHRCFVRLKWSF